MGSKKKDSVKEKQRNRCFFKCLAVSEILREKQHTISSFFKMVNQDEINEKCDELFETYANEFKLTNVERALFNGVHLNLIPTLEHLFGYRIDVYTMDVDDNGKIKFDIAAKAQSRYVYTSKKKPMTLLLYDAHYYLLLDKDRVMNGRYACFGCGKIFSKSANLMKHARSNCVKNEPQKKYASGSVISSKLLLVQIKETFDVPDDILPPLIYDSNNDNNAERELLHPTANDMYFTKKFATFDFESKLQKTTIDDIKKSRLEYMKDAAAADYSEEIEDDLRSFEFAEEMESQTIRQTLDEEMVYSDEGELITGREFRELYGDEDYIMKNVAVSYAIAHNFANEILQDERFANEIEEYNYVEEDALRSDKCSINRSSGCVTFSRSNANSKDLIESFYNDLKEVAKHYRIQNHIRYASLVDYLKDWFERRKIKLNITPPDSNEQIELDIFDDDHELMMTNANINMNNDAIATPIVDDDDNAASAASLRRIAASAAAFQQQQNTRVDLNEVDGKSLIENLSRELRMMDDFKKFLEMPVILGYNSGKYDIPLIKKDFFHQVCVKDAHPTDKRHLNIIRKGASCYTSIQLSNMNLRASGGCYGFVLKDMREFTGPGGNLKTFMKAFQESTTTTTTTTTQANNSDLGKFHFPYEWLERYEQLKETELPPYECFFSSLKDMNVLEEDMFLYKKKKKSTSSRR